MLEIVAELKRPTILLEADRSQLFQEKNGKIHRYLVFELGS